MNSGLLAVGRGLGAQGAVHAPVAFFMSFIHAQSPAYLSLPCGVVRLRACLESLLGPRRELFARPTRKNEGVYVDT